MPTGKRRVLSTLTAVSASLQETTGRMFSFHSSALPSDALQSQGDGARGPGGRRTGTQALSVRFLKETASVARAKRRKPQAMVLAVEDLIKLRLDVRCAAVPTRTTRLRSRRCCAPSQRNS